MMKHHQRIRYLLCSTGIVILFFCMTLGVARGVGSLYAYQAMTALNLLRDQKVQPRQIDWQAVRKNLEMALSYDARNPDYLHELGTAYDAEFSFQAVGSSVAAENRRLAERFYLEALQRRPAWPLDWIDVALVKYRLGETGQDFKRALTQAHQLGPWEQWVQYVIADTGMHHWLKLTEEERGFVLGVIQQGLQNRAGDISMIELVQRYNMLDTICASARDVSVQVLNYCAQHTGGEVTQ